MQAKGWKTFFRLYDPFRARWRALSAGGVIKQASTPISKQAREPASKASKQASKLYALLIDLPHATESPPACTKRIVQSEIRFFSLWPACSARFRRWILPIRFLKHGKRASQRMENVFQIVRSVSCTLGGSQRGGHSAQSHERTRWRHFRKSHAKPSQPRQTRGHLSTRWGHFRTRGGVFRTRRGHFRIREQAHK